MGKLLKKGGKLVKKDGRLVRTDNPATCTCCGECDGTCNPDNNPLTKCASAALTCFQNDCEPEPGFPECVDYTRPDAPDSGSLKAIIKAQGYDVVIDDSKTHPEGCCDCKDVNHFTVWGCCTGVINKDERFVRTALRKQEPPCETCVPRGDGIEAGVDANGNPVWRVFLCDPPDKRCCAVCEEPLNGGACPPGFVERGGKCFKEIDYNCDPQIFAQIVADYPECKSGFQSNNGPCPPPPCNAANCCIYEEFIGVEAEAVSPGWTVTPIGVGSTLFQKPGKCDGPDSELFTWREVGNPANEQTFPAFLRPGGFCCGNECSLAPCPEDNPLP